MFAFANKDSGMGASKTIKRWEKILNLKFKKLYFE
jgi:hypothetical protein